MKKATTIEQQIEILRSRGMTIDVSEEKAKEVLLDIGYFKLGFYCFPFEKDYPRKENRSHEYKSGTKFSDVINLYYLDVNLRYLLTKYINRIEVNFRTKVIYEVSLSYPNSNTWFVDPTVMDKSYIDKFDTKVYNDTFKNNNVIKLHHKKYINDKYAPAWKTMEFVTFGGVLNVLRNLKDPSVKQKISNHFGIGSISVLENYIESIVKIRNVCAHSTALFDFTLPKSLKKGPALKITQSNKNQLQSVIRVVLFILGKISVNRKVDLEKEITGLFDEYKNDKTIRCIIENCIGYSFAE